MLDGVSGNAVCVCCGRHFFVLVGYLLRCVALWLIWWLVRGCIADAMNSKTSNPRRDSREYWGREDSPFLWIGHVAYAGGTRVIEVPWSPSIVVHKNDVILRRSNLGLWMARSTGGWSEIFVI